MIPTPFTKEQLIRFYDMIYEDFFGEPTDYKLHEDPNTLVVIIGDAKWIFKFNNNRDYSLHAADRKELRYA